MNWFFMALSMVPAIEARGASIYFLCSGQAFLVPFTVILNFLAVVVFIKLLEMGHVPNRIEGFLRNKLDKHHSRVDRWFGKYGNLAIFLLIAVPSTGVGSFTGSFIGRAFGLRGKVFYASVFLAIVFSLTISFVVAYLMGAMYISCDF